MTKKISLRDNEKGSLEPANNKHYFDVRILMIDYESYDKVSNYLTSAAVRIEESERGIVNYFLDETGKEVIRGNRAKRVVELKLTKEVGEEIKDGIERIIAGYNPHGLIK